MNVNTGEMYYGDAEIEAAKQRGEPVVAVSRDVALLVEAGRDRLAENAAQGGKPLTFASLMAERRRTLKSVFSDAGALVTADVEP